MRSMADLSNTAIAAAFDELGDLYELDGAIIHRVVAYRNAAKAVRDTSQSVAARARKLFDELGIDSLDALRDAAASGRLKSVRGFGPRFEESVLAAFDAGVAA